MIVVMNRGHEELSDDAPFYLEGADRSVREPLVEALDALAAAILAQEYQADCFLRNFSPNDDEVH